MLQESISPATTTGRELGTILLFLLQGATVVDQEDICLEALLKATCMTHIAGTGLLLITLFVTLKAIFNKTECATLEWLAYPELLQSVDKIH